MKQTFKPAPTVQNIFCCLQGIYKVLPKSQQSRKLNSSKCFLDLIAVNYAALVSNASVS